MGEGRDAAGRSASGAEPAGGSSVRRGLVRVLAPLVAGFAAFWQTPDPGLADHIGIVPDVPDASPGTGDPAG